MSVSWIENQSIPHAVVAEDARLSKEVMVFCPSCKSFETIWFTKGTLNSTRKFTQYGNHVYHDCGSNEPCRLYLTL
ncbi:MAG: hypothetical protein ACLPVI_02895 [Dehalococcoidales bacterium]